MKNFFRSVWLFLIFSGTAIVVNGQELTANVSVIDITPPLEMKYTLGGYGERMNKPAEGIHDRINAKALVFRKGELKYAIITLDILGLPTNVKTDLLKKFPASGWSKENTMLLPSHSHGSLEMSALNSRNKLGIPQIGIFQPELLEFLISKLETLLRQADRDFKPVMIGTGCISLEGLNRNRRKDPDLDKELIVSRIDLLNGKPLAVLVNWTAHPTFIDGSDMLVSAEWPGYLQSGLEKMIAEGVEVLYFNGAEGDHSPVLNEQAGAYDKVQVYGNRIAEKAFGLYKQIKPQKVNYFNYSYSVMKLPDQVAHPSFMKTGGTEYGLTEQTVGTVLKMLCPDEVGLGAVRIGDLLIAAVPGEMTSVLGLKLKQKLKEAGISHPAIGGLASEWISYILSRNQYINGEGYESSMSFYGPDLGELISDAVLKSALPLTTVK